MMSEPFSQEWLVELYLKYGSVDEAIRRYDGVLPVSVADFHRKVADFGVVKTEGRRRTSLAQAVYFFAQKAIDPKIPLETLYRSMPPSFKESASVATIHRIYNHTLNKVTRLHTTAVVLSNHSDPREILVADEAKSKELTIPLSRTGGKVSPRDSVLQVLQHEFSTKLTLERKLVKGSVLVNTLIPEEISPFLKIHVLDVAVSCYHITIPPELTNLEECSSFKVSNHRFISTNKLLKEKERMALRLGVPEIIDYFQGKILEQKIYQTSTSLSSLNQSLLATAKLQ